ncbi:D-alanyl-D-alanine carboxypeptidase [Arboricoccus pini]|uniref:D-alanyl-D-alanine carboxypeptidase n=1 Tax=Arboricoccus pini TaxID=1963835 RepID=A0A212R2V0_9PROT|nr:serine hydrolase [Arboricoccus pini]SNB66320.1 D-alanyl-D-alanine carboxypeptidase [Arboricoccus pini]
MPKSMRSGSVWVGAILLVLLTATSAIARTTYIVVDHLSGSIISSDGADEVNYPASLTKMMTLYLLFDALEQHRLTLDSPIHISAHAASMPPTKMGLKPGSTIRVEDAIYAVIIRSANDVAAAIGEELGGSEQRFAQIMTRTARQIGMRSTTFRNASGLPDDQQVTTARDIATLARHLISDHPTYYHYFSAEGFNFRGRRINTHNPLVITYKGMDGLKTGYIHAAGYNLASSAVRDGRRLVGVILGGQSTAQRNQTMVRLLDAAWNSVPQKPMVAGLSRNTTVASTSTETIPVSGRQVYIAKAAPQFVAPNDSVQGFVDASTPMPQAGGEEAATRRSVRSRPTPPAASVATKSRRATTGAFALQVGAFKQRSSALDMAKTSMKSLRGLPSGAGVDVARASRGKAVYLARIVGLDRAAADRACAVLKKSSHQCFVVPAGEIMAAN